MPQGAGQLRKLDSFMKGKETLKDVFVIPNDPKANFLMDVITEAKMPPSGMRLPDNEIAILTKWIASGAKYDGKDPQESLRRLAPGVRGADRPESRTGGRHRRKISSPTTSLRCLMNRATAALAAAAEPEGMFNLATFDALLRGSDAGGAGWCPANRLRA